MNEIGILGKSCDQEVVVIDTRSYDYEENNVLFMKPAALWETDADRMR